ncbi:hypothetical protein CROQUDRAFT_665067 [Cronartium quercuum f. sp. fusiforme G11]|uniref:MIOS-like alpha-solenoid domain-containing protein n=1 Tax=Cronartium quercuum f. sp. fusiforme G11 TaxID=708437 RepID=A0A9P6N766_9BASI|nr:hypothetical protein CROQUDRAFT_665067 [Cronartium quercuum f. sp. fusiforme G11]
MKDSISNLNPIKRYNLIWQTDKSNSNFNRFLLISSTNLRIYQTWYHVKKQTIHHQLIYTNNQIPSSRAFDWTTNFNQQFDLLAGATITGKAFIIRLPRLPSNLPQPEPSLITFSAARNPIARPSTTIALSPSGRLLALGLEKGRDYGLQVYDVNRITADQSNPINSTDPHIEQTPLAYAVSAETITDIAFLSSSILVVASSTKSIRLYDLHSAGLEFNDEKGKGNESQPSPTIIPQVLSPIAQWSTRSVLGIKPDPFESHRFATWGEDGYVRIWDTRKTTNELLIIYSEEDVRVLNNRSSSSTRLTKNIPPSSALIGIHSLTWSRVRKGLLVTISNDPQRVRVWDLVEYFSNTTTLRSRSDGLMTTRNPAPPPPSGSFRTRSPQASPSVSVPDYSTYTIFSTRLLKPLNRPSQAIVSAQMNYSTNPKDIYLSISRDGHLEFINFKRSGEATFGSKSNMIFSDGMRLRISATARPQSLALNEPQPRWPVTSALTSANIIQDSPKLSFPEQDQFAHRPYPDFLVHPNPSTPQFKRLPSEVAVLQLGNKFGRHLSLNTVRDERASNDPLRNDISVIMMSRATAGYGSNFFRNQQLASDNPGLSAFWEWIAHSQKLFQQGNGLVNGYDFSFQGVLSIMKGFTKSGDNLQLETARPTSSSQKPGVRSSSIDRKPMPTPDQRKQINEYIKAIRTFNHTRSIDNFTISSTDYSHQRQTALYFCGSDYNSKDIDQISTKYESLGMYGKASAIAFFSGNTQRAITSLQRSNDTQLQLLAPALATHLNTQRSGHARDPLFDQVCRKLADDGTTEPYIRAFYAYCSTSDWHEVIDETGLPLKDRIAVALRFLSDDEIFQWLDSVSKDMIQSGDLEGVLLTGLAGQEGIRLLQHHVNRTGDVQTVAISTSQLPFRSLQLDRCIETYRRLLDRWELFNVRIKFDIARGRHAREYLTSKQPSIIQTVAQMFPPQLIIRCQHCSEILSDAPNITPTSYPTSSSDLNINNPNLVGMASFKPGPTPLMRRVKTSFPLFLHIKRRKD